MIGECLYMSAVSVFAEALNAKEHLVKFLYEITRL